MARLEVPLKHRTLWSTGDLLLRADLVVRLKDSFGGWHTATFRVDSGSEITTMPAYFASRMSLPVPRSAARGVVHRQTGLTMGPIEQPEPLVIA
jgi:hypothetical protein